MSIEALISKQNPDGGWPYIRGTSRTEPTAYAIMTLLAAEQRDAAARGVHWLRSTQRRDGGWAPQPGVDQSNWTTGLVALLSPETMGRRSHQGAIEWLMGTTGQESTFENRLRLWLLGNTIPKELDFTAWPWTPGAAAWVGPTAVAIMALEKENRRRPLLGIRQRVDAGRKFLLSRVCPDGGWNYGPVRPVESGLKSYPETTGMALAALRGVRSPEIARSVAVAREFLGDSRSADAQNWLRLGLLAHGALPAGYCRPLNLAFRTVPEASLDLLLSDATGGDAFFGR
jgi:squalene cyclase